MIERIHQCEKKLSEDIRRRFQALGAATIYEGNHRCGAMDSAIKPISDMMKCCGRALTVHCPPGDNLTLLLAMDLAGEGDVIVCDCGGISELGHWGDLMTTQALFNGSAGLIIDGGVRDSEELATLGFPVFCRNICIKGTGKKIFGSINEPVDVGGVHVEPGDLVCGDRDGVTVVRYEELESALAGGEAREAREQVIKTQIKEGKRMFDIMGFMSQLPEEINKQREIWKRKV